MFGSIVQRVIIVELIKIFTITLISLTALFLLGGLVAEASQRGLAPAQIFRIMPLMIPSMLPYTIPTTTLFATCNVYGRMAKDNEIVALRAAGVNLFQILKPAILLGTFATIATGMLLYDVIPNSFRAMRDRVTGDINEFLITVLKRQGSFRHSKLPYVVFAREVHGDRLIDVIVKRKLSPQSPTYDTVARAREAHMRIEKRFDPETKRSTEDMVIDMVQCVVCSADRNGGKPNVVSFQNWKFTEPLPPEVFGDKDQPRSSDVPWPELFRRAEQYRERNEAWVANMEATALAARSAGNDPNKDEHLQNLRNQYRGLLREYRAFEAEKHLRPALALGCLCFSLIGVPIGIWANRADFLSSFIIGFLPIIMIYYPILISGQNFAKDGRAPISVAMWSADVLFGIVAMSMCWRLVRR